jgi:hypothetical protein
MVRDGSLTVIERAREQHGAEGSAVLAVLNNLQRLISSGCDC